MIRPSFKQMIAVAVVTLMCLLPVANASVVQGNLNTITLSLSVTETITETCTPATITFTYSASGGGTASASGPVTCSRSWNLGSSRTVMDESAWLGDPAAALYNGISTNIGASQVFDSFDGSTATACTGTENGSSPMAGVPVAGALCSNFGMNITNANRSGSDSHTHLLSMQSLGVLPASTFSGVLNVQSAAN